MYDASGETLQFSQWACVALGTWHVYKMATVLVWRLAAADFIAPLFHVLFPRAPFKESPRLSVAARILSLIRLAYPSFKKELTEAIQTTPKSTSEYNHLLNLQYLCEWLIPKVIPNFMIFHCFLIFLIFHLFLLAYYFRFTISVYLFGLQRIPLLESM